MNFHIEHHMFPTAPCYNLGWLYTAMQHDLPLCPVSLIAAWTEIAAILRRQAAVPSYQHVTPYSAARITVSKRHSTPTQS